MHPDIKSLAYLIGEQIRESMAAVEVRVHAAMQAAIEDANANNAKTVNDLAAQLRDEIAAVAASVVESRGKSMAELESAVTDIGTHLGGTLVAELGVQMERLSGTLESVKSSAAVQLASAEQRINDSMVDAVTSLLGQMEDLRADITFMRESVSTGEDAIRGTIADETARVADGAAKSVAELRLALDNTAARFEDMLTTVEHSALEAVRTAAEEATAKTIALGATVEGHRAYLKAFDARLAETEAKSKQLDDEAAQYETKVAAAITELSERVSTVRDGMFASVREHAAQIDALGGQIEALGAELRAADTALHAEAEKAVAGLPAEVSRAVTEALPPLVEDRLAAAEVRTADVVTEAAGKAAEGQILRWLEEAHDRNAKQIREALATIRQPLDGRDATFAAPVPWAEGKTYPHNALVTHHNGTWCAFRSTSEEPSAKALDWVCMSPGMLGVEVGRAPDGTERDLEVVVRTSLGEQRHPVKVPAVIYCGVYVDGTKYERGDAVTHAGSLWIAQGDTKQMPGTPGAEKDWKLAVKKGRDGKNGTDAKPLQENVRGVFKKGELYHKMDIVRHGKRYWLAIRETHAEPPHHTDMSDDNWIRLGD